MQFPLLFGSIQYQDKVVEHIAPENNKVKVHQNNLNRSHRNCIVQA